jgi:hypothetical protein
LVNGCCGESWITFPPGRTGGVKVGVPVGMAVGAGATVGTVLGAGGTAGAAGIAVSHAGAEVASPHMPPHFGVKKPTIRSSSRGRHGRASHPTVGTSARAVSGTYCTRGRAAVGSHPVADKRFTGTLTVPQFAPAAGAA